MKYPSQPFFPAAAVAITLLVASSARAELYINEIFFDPGGQGSDLRDEYIELRGTPSMSLANHYLIFIENENDEDNAGGAGIIENIFDLNSNAANPELGQTLGTNGFLTFRQRNNTYTVAPGTNDRSNNGASAGIGWGSDATSLVGHSAIAGGVVVENSGFTAMLIRNDGHPADNRPVLGVDLDAGNDGLDHSNGQPDWTILDAIGIHSEFGEAYYGRTYARTNFGPEIVGQPIFPGGPEFTTPNIEPGAAYVGLGFEVEYIGRWGNSIAHAATDWHASNFTDDPGSGSLGVPDWRQSCQDVAGSCHPASDGNPNTPAPQVGPAESSQDVPYGTKLAASLGAPNYITGDFNRDGVVDAADYIVWRGTLDHTGSESNHPPADANHDFNVNSADHAIWQSRFGQPQLLGSGSAAPRTAIPEPATAALACLATVTLLLRRR